MADAKQEREAREMTRIPTSRAGRLLRVMRLIVRICNRRVK